jgi:hypothetical protein
MIEASARMLPPARKAQSGRRQAHRAFALALFVAAQPWTQAFPVDTKALVTEGESTYFILKPGHQATFEGKEDGKAAKLVITVLPETVTVGGVVTRVVEEREWQGGQIVEVSRNFFAMDPKTGDVYYFGEDVDMYKNGRVVSHEGAWRHGSNSARFGLMMPGTPTVGMRFYQELAPRVAMDRAEIVSMNETLTTPAGTFTKCLKTRESTPLESGSEYKIYAPGVGLVQDSTLKLVSRTTTAR